MQLPVLVEAVAGGGYVAKASAPFDWTAAGATADEAVRNLQAEADRHTSNGSRVDVIHVPDQHPWMKWAGTWDPNDPMIVKYLRCVEEYRQSIDDNLDPF